MSGRGLLVSRVGIALAVSAIVMIGLHVVLVNQAHAESDVVNLKSKQVWSFKGGLQGETLTIGVIEQLHHEAVVSISLSNVFVPENVRANFGGRLQTEIGHLPFSKAAILNSLEDLISEDGEMAEEFESGYGIWKKAVDEKRAGYFTASVSEVRDIVLNNNGPLN